MTHPFRGHDVMNEIATIRDTCADLEQKLQQAEQPARAAAGTKAGRMRELMPPSGSQYRVALQDTAATGTCLVLRMELPASASSCNSVSNAKTTLAFLGRLADSLASHDVTKQKAD
jgi:hypothetical protein